MSTPRTVTAVPAGTSFQFSSSALLAEDTLFKAEKKSWVVVTPAGSAKCGLLLTQATEESKNERPHFSFIPNNASFALHAIQRGNPKQIEPFY